MVHFLHLCELVARLGGVHILEHPDDPGCEPFPSVFDTVLLQEMEARLGASRVRVHQ